MATTSFKISGEYLTDFYRDLVIEGNWRKAYELLSETFMEQVSTDIIMDILSGKKKLVGINEFDIVDDDKFEDSEWRFDQYFTYFSNLFYVDNVPYKAYAIVEALVYDDAVKAREFIGDGQWFSTSKEDLNVLRAKMYARNISSDCAVYDKDAGHWVLGEKYSNDFPIWITPTQRKEMLDIKEYQPRYGLIRVNTLSERDFKIQEQVEENRRFEESREQWKAYYANEATDQEESDKQYNERIEQYKRLVEEQANNKGGWISVFDEESGRNYTIPKHPFYKWVLRNNPLINTIEWDTVCPIGLKMMNDDPNHSDWWLFTGHDLEQVYEDGRMDCFYDKAATLNDELTSQDFILMNTGSAASKTYNVCHIKNYSDIDKIEASDVVIIPNGSPEYTDIALKCASLKIPLIMEVGGKLCHLSIISNENSLTLLMIPDAMEKFKNGSKLWVSKDSVKIRDNTY